MRLIIKLIRITLFLINLLLVKTTIGQSDDNVLNHYQYSLKFRGSIGGFYDQFSINPFFCYISNNHEYSFGLLYKEIKYHYLISWREVPARSKCYGISFGYINKVKANSGIRLRFETNLNLVLLTTQVLFNQENINLRKVYAGIIQYGPNLTVPICKKIEINFLLQLAIEYGIEGSGPAFIARQHGSGFYPDLIHCLDINYKF